MTPLYDLTASAVGLLAVAAKRAHTPMAVAALNLALTVVLLPAVGAYLVTGRES